MAKGDWSTVPAWARQEFNSLQQSRDTLERELRQFQGAEDSPITMRRLTSLDHYPVPDAVVRFHLGIERWIDIRIDGDTLDVNGSRTFLPIQPLAANHCTLTVKDPAGRT